MTSSLEMCVFVGGGRRERERMYKCKNHAEYQDIDSVKIFLKKENY